MSVWIYFAVGSVFGGISRYWVASKLHHWVTTSFPVGIMAVNLLGCLVAGFVNGATENKVWMSPKERLILLTGFCGAFTTFSALMLDSVALFERRHWFQAAANIALNTFLGFLLLAAGNVTGRYVVGKLP
jgi:fluoride exporter